MNTYFDIPLRLPEIDFKMSVTDLIMEMEQLRYKILRGTTHPLVFSQVKSLFHMLESIGSSRIEGNNTTIMDYVESAKIQDHEMASDAYPFEESIREINNIEQATQYIEDSIADRPITLQYVRELHTMTVHNLSTDKEGCLHPGYFRKHNVRISGSSHIPPDYTQVDSLMQELIEFVNQETAPKYDLLKICIAHHRFVWIHPFENGNGRVVRLFTYAMLLKYVFTSKQRIINPTAVFCSNRDAYYSYLSQADTGTDQGLISWSVYVLEGLKREIEKIDKLMDYSYLREEILQPAIEHAVEHRYITETELAVLTVTLLNPTQELQAKDLKPILGNKTASDISRIIRKLIEKKMLMPIKESARKYVICFSNNYLMRSMLIILDKKGFLPINS